MCSSDLLVVPSPPDIAQLWDGQALEQQPLVQWCWCNLTLGLGPKTPPPCPPPPPHHHTRSSNNRSRNTGTRPGPTRASHIGLVTHTHTHIHTHIQFLCISHLCQTICTAKFVHLTWHCMRVCTKLRLHQGTILGSKKIAQKHSS